jgi:hypothetical protein
MELRKYKNKKLPANDAKYPDEGRKQIHCVSPKPEMAIYIMNYDVAA